MTTRTQSTLETARPAWLVWREKEAAYQADIARLETLLTFAQSETARLEKAFGEASRELRGHMAERLIAEKNRGHGMPPDCQKKTPAPIADL